MKIFQTLKGHIMNKHALSTTPLFGWWARLGCKPVGFVARSWSLLWWLIIHETRLIKSPNCVKCPNCFGTVNKLDILLHTEYCEKMQFFSRGKPVGTKRLKGKSKTRRNNLPGKENVTYHPFGGPSEWDAHSVGLNSGPRKDSTTLISAETSHDTAL